MVDQTQELEAEKELGEIFATLSHPMVRHMVGLLAIAPRTAAELTEHFDINSAMAKTAAETLRKRGLATKSDDSELYRLDDRGFRLVRNWLAGVLAA